MFCQATQSPMSRQGHRHANHGVTGYILDILDTFQSPWFPKSQIGLQCNEWRLNPCRPSPNQRNQALPQPYQVQTTLPSESYRFLLYSCRALSDGDLIRYVWFVCLFCLFVWGKPLEARWFTPTLDTLGFNRAKALRIAALDSWSWQVHTKCNCQRRFV